MDIAPPSRPSVAVPPRQSAQMTPVAAPPVSPKPAALAVSPTPPQQPAPPTALPVHEAPKNEDEKSTSTGPNPESEAKKMSEVTPPEVPAAPEPTAPAHAAAQPRPSKNKGQSSVGIVLGTLFVMALLSGLTIVAYVNSR